MTTLDLANPQHVEALRWACSNHESEFTSRLLAHTFETYGTLDERSKKAPTAMALRAISGPALAAELVRGLLERCGIIAVDFEEPGVAELIVWAADEGPLVGHVLIEGRHGLDVNVPLANIPGLVLALLGATSAAEAMAAVERVVR